MPNPPDQWNKPPILRHKRHHEESLFTPHNLLREAQRQKGIPAAGLPRICLLDPDGDIVRNLTKSGQARPDGNWACYHTTLYRFSLGEIAFGIVGCAVGAPFAVLIAEEMFACGCELLISVTSSGRIAPRDDGIPPPYFVLIEKALRDEGTSYHYLPADEGTGGTSDYCEIQGGLGTLLAGAYDGLDVAVSPGATWTTDAPFRETPSAIEHHRSEGIAAVEMEAAALYALAKAKNLPIVCFAHVTNQMANVEGDFEKGEAEGSRDALAVIEATAKRWLARR